MAALVDIALFEKIRTMRAEFDRLIEKIGKTYQGVDEATAFAEIDEAISAVRQQSR